MIGSITKIPKASKVLSPASKLTSKIGRSAGSILKTSGGGIVGGAAGGYSLASLEQYMGQQEESRRLLIIGGAVLLAAYSLGQLFDIQIGG